MRFFCMAFTLVMALTLGQGCWSRTDRDAQNDSETNVKAVPAYEHYMDVDRRDSLTIYCPVFKSIDLVTETMPSKTEEDVILCFEAAFTGERLDEFRHSNIAGHHVSGGTFHKGYKCGTNNGVFTWDSARACSYMKESGSKAASRPGPRTSIGLCASWTESCVSLTVRSRCLSDNTWMRL